LHAIARGQTHPANLKTARFGANLRHLTGKALAQQAEKPNVFPLHPAARYSKRG
jgi:hypothetical protein